MALSPSEEALVRGLIAQNAALLSLASSEPTILSKLGATKATLSNLPVASSLSDTDLFLVRQGTTDRSAPRSLVAGGFAKVNGSASQVFNVAAGTSATQAVRFDQVLGLGQTWQDVTGSRSFGTTYTNTTGRPIALSLRTSPINNSFVNVTVGGVLIARRWGGESWAPEITIFAIVPAGSTYSVASSHEIESWCELR